MKITEIKTYEDARDIFFKKMNKVLSDKIQTLISNGSYSESQPLGELLEQLSDEELAYYIWKDAYLQAYVFDKYDQRRELMNALEVTKIILKNESIKKTYIENHDILVKERQNKSQNDYLNMLIK